MKIDKYKKKRKEKNKPTKLQIVTLIISITALVISLLRLLMQ